MRLLMQMHLHPWRALALCALLAWPALAAAQTTDDGIMLAKGTLFAGQLYTRDSWDEYWEGALKRSNGNIGTLTTQTVTMITAYSATQPPGRAARVSYAWTH